RVTAPVRTSAVCTRVLKPSAVAGTLYLLLARLGSSKVPLLVVGALRSSLVPRFWSVIVAAATTAPDESVTSPEIVPVMVCPRLGRLKQTNISEPTTERPHSDRMSCPLGTFGCHARW